ncbi:MAG TPA: SDR family NAD(P)-dependent oxidoreductase [Pyrinomonadaceae bacterium]|nr:SDR family NAD(P)-dependent oxidoreductase [Pyrinomonadaceae bacterium]
MSQISKNNALFWGVAGVGALLAARTLLGQFRRINLQDKIVLITGGSRGLGLVMAREFAAEGAKIAICARDLDELARAKEDLEARGAEVFTVTCDLMNKAEIGQMVNAVRMHYGQIDILINNAGVIQVTPMENATEADYQEAMNTHFWACFHTISEVLPEMRERREGRIVNITSIGGKVAVPHLLPYSASKFALVGYSEGLRAELLKDNILVTTVVPGLMRTGSPRNAFFKGQNEKEYAWFKISDSLPFLSVSAEQAAREIVAVTKRGDAELIISLPAKLGVVVHGLFPGLTADLFSLANQFLPAPGGIGEQRMKGSESESAASQSFLTGLTDQAAEQNNEVAS